MSDERAKPCAARLRNGGWCVLEEGHQPPDKHGRLVEDVAAESPEPEPEPPTAKLMWWCGPNARRP